MGFLRWWLPRHCYVVGRAFLGGCYDVIDGLQGIKVYKDIK